ncbi:phage baseplate upper protein [Listeria innocua]|uniref:phage baseplate upper protein n=1 Tax=Listeria innocua TaxID=1642 RepID=UPI001888575E|nr:phage baseplate upper protein [Listeria innocua]MBF2609333.1 phage baseplate upper protein [Listeria innocua]MBF2700151.1 phage baseplate upper protein [Listeria innocua]
MTNKIFKSAILDFSVSAQNAKANVPQILFNTQDSGGTARLIFTAKKEDNSLPLSSAAKITLAMVMSVGEEYESKYVVNPVITNRAKGIFEYSLTDDQISHNGQVNAELYVKYPEQAMQINRFNFEIEKAMIDDNFFPVATYYVERWDNYEKIFDESVAELSNKLEALDVRADNIQTQFDSFNPSQFVKKIGDTLTGNLQFDGVPTIFQAKQSNAWWYRLTSENSTTCQQSLFPTIVSGINGIQGAGYNFKQAYLKLNNVDVETVTGAQARADKALDDAKTDSQAKANQALIDANIYTDNSSKEKLVWSGSSYFLDTHTFSWDAAKVKHGVLLEFSRYDPGTGVLDYGYIQYFFSKEYLVRNNNKATWLNMPGATDGAKKTVRLTPTSVSGDATNGQAPSTSYALRTVAIF